MISVGVAYLIISRNWCTLSASLLSLGLSSFNYGFVNLLLSLPITHRCKQDECFLWQSARACYADLWLRVLVYSNPKIVPHWVWHLVTFGCIRLLVFAFFIWKKLISHLNAFNLSCTNIGKCRRLWIRRKCPKRTSQVTLSRNQTIRMYLSTCNKLDYVISKSKVQIFM